MSTILETFTPKGLGYPSVGSMMNPLAMQQYLEKLVDREITKKIGPTEKHFTGMAYNPEKLPYVDKQSGVRVEPQTIYAAVKDFEGVPPWKVTQNPIPLINVKNFAIAQEKIAAGSMSDAAQYNHILEPHLVEEAKAFYSKVASGAIIHSGDYLNIKEAQMLTSLINLEEKTYTIDQSFRTIQSGDILVDIDTYHRFELGGFDKGELETVDPIKGDYETLQLLMRKSMGALEYTDEAFMVPRRQNILGDSLQNLVSEFRRIIAKKVANEYTAIATETAGGGNLLSFDANTERSTINIPLIVGNAGSEIDDPPNNGQGQTLAMHPTTWRKWLMNTWGRVVGQPVTVGPFGQSTIIQIARGLETFTVYLDKLLPVGKIWVIDNRYGFQIQGPVLTENSRDSDRGSNKVTIRNWHKIILIYPLKFGRFITAT